ncbi:MAG: hypothetical protein AAGG68_26115 [Bacteroidota bacterium]
MQILSHATPINFIYQLLLTSPLVVFIKPMRAGKKIKPIMVIAQLLTPSIMEDPKKPRIPMVRVMALIQIKTSLKI